MASKGFLPLLKTTYTEWSGHNAPRLGASVAFYSILSFAPLVVLTVALIALVFGKSSAQSTLIGEAHQLMGDRGASTVESLLKNAQKPSSGVISSIIAFLTLLFGASGVFTELRDALDIMWDAKRKQTSGVLAMLKDRLFSFGMVLSVGFLLLVSLLLSAVLAFINHAFSQLFPVPPFLLQLLNFGVSFVVVAALFGLMFKYMPAARTAWRDVTVGALGTALLFTVGKFLLGIYIGKASVGSTYGAAGSLVAVVVWIYYSAQIFFFGAEFTHIYAERHAGIAKEAPRNEPLAEPAKADSPRAVAAAAAAGTQQAMQQAFAVAQPSLVEAPVPRPAVLRTVADVPQAASSSKTKPKLLMAMGLGFILGRAFLRKKEAATRPRET